MLTYNKHLKLVLFLPLFLQADENLSQYIMNLEERIEVLEQENKSNNILNFQSMNTHVFLGGKITLDSTYLQTANGKEGGNNSSDQFFNANNIPINSKGEESELSLTARNSKFWIKTRTNQINAKPLMTLLEFDFWGSNGTETNSNSHNPRLRHAYILYNGWTIGQTNSLFVESFKPHTLLSPVDDVFMRQPLISYKQSFNKNSLALSFEQAESVIMLSTGAKTTINDEQFPDIILKYEHALQWSNYSLALLARELRINQEAQSTETDSTFAYGLNFTTHIHTYQEDTLTLGMVGGKGIGRYMATSFFPSAVLNDKGKLEAQFSWGTHASYEHWLRKDLRVNFAIGKIETDPILALESIDKSAWSGHIGLQYNPLKKFLLALEYIHGERVLQNNNTYSVDRLYLRTSYDF
ncbi:MAG: Unknown protein [uncultured Sulfurovum sp.]|uniref:Porin n=1 Tax=uncultured Sulfurovum sp. TaxID=269237 RepID=A0A6S6U5T7_9BACT|nr:MAG: Unknown protein [uncultured Sulfurovum sp.]